MVNNFCLQAPAQPVLSPPPRPQPASARQSKEIRGGLGTREARMSARNAPDNHQVFIGNLPNNVKDDEVRNVFASKYATSPYVACDACFIGWVSALHFLCMVDVGIWKKTKTGMRRKCKATGCILGCPRTIWFLYIP